MQIRNEKSAVCCCIFHENLHGFFCPCFADDVSNLLFKQNGPIRLAMKRTAAQAGLPDNPHRLRLTVVVPPDKVTDDRTMSFFVDCDTTFTVDHVKWTLLNQIYLTTGKAPCISSFQLQQEGQHLPYTQQITCLKSLSPLQLVRTAPDCDQ